MDRSATSPRRSDRIWVIAIGLVVALGAAVRIWAALQWRMNFDSDEAIFALMARHILQGHFTPVVYGTEHLGSIESILSAAAMAVAGQSVVVFRASALLLMAAFLILTPVYVARHWGLRAAFLTAVFLAIPGFHVLEWTFQPIGAYAAMLAIGMTIVLLCERIPQDGGRRYAMLFLIGGLVGLGMWSNQMTVLFVAAALIPTVMGSDEWERGSRLLAKTLDRLTRGQAPLALGMLTALIFILGVAAFFVSGCDPSWRFSKVQWLARGILGIGVVASALCLLILSRARKTRVYEGSLLGLGVIVGYSPLWASWLLTDLGPVNVIRRSCPTGVVNRGLLMIEQILPALWGVPILAELRNLPASHLAAWGLVMTFIIVALVWFGLRRWQLIKRAWTLQAISPGDQPDLGLLIMVVGPLALSLFGSNTVDIYSVRHLIVAWFASAVVFGMAIDRLMNTRRLLGVVVACLWVGLLAGAALSTANGNWRVKFTTYPQGAVDQLVATLSTQGIDSGYADYWGAYTLDYLSGERITIAPYDGIDRYPAYTKYVRRQSRLAFVFPSSRSPDRSRGVDGLGSLLRLPNDVSGEGAAKRYVLDDLAAAHLEAVIPIGPWRVWIVSR